MIMTTWKKLCVREEKVGYKKVTYKDFEMPDGRVEEYTTWGVAGTQSIATIALTKDNRVIIARQFRPGPEMIFDELPGGGVNDGEDLEVAARRELREETGYETTGQFRFIGKAYKDAYTNEVHHFFLARDCELTSGQELDDNEHVEAALITVAQLFENARCAKMSDSVALVFAQDELRNIFDAQS